MSQYINKKYKIERIELSNKEVKSSQGKINGYELMIKVNLFSGKSYLSNEKARDLIAGVRRLIDEIKSLTKREAGVVSKYNCKDYVVGNILNCRCFSPVLF